MISSKNQQNPPLPKKKRVDSKGNDKRRVFAKSGTATLLLVSDLTENGAQAFIESFKENVKHLGGKVECSFIKLR